MLKIVKNKIPTEDSEQIAFCQWLTANKIVFYHIPNGGSRNIVEAVKLKRLGVKRGIPDICIPVPFNQYHALYIEMKRTSQSVLSDYQIAWIEKLNELGCLAVVAKGCEEAIEHVRAYFRKDHVE